MYDFFNGRHWCIEEKCECMDLRSLSEIADQFKALKNVEDDISDSVHKMRFKTCTSSRKPVFWKALFKTIVSCEF